MASAKIPNEKLPIFSGPYPVGKKIPSTPRTLREDGSKPEEDHSQEAEGETKTVVDRILDIVRPTLRWFSYINTYIRSNASSRIQDTVKDVHQSTSNASGDGIQRLSEFVNYVSYHVDISNIYTPGELQRQTSYVENLVQTICKSLGNRNPALIVNEIIKRGSFYDKTKILQPNEYDFLAVLAMFEPEVIEVRDLSEKCWLTNNGCYHIKVNRESLKHPLPDNCIKKHGGESYIQIALVKSLILRTVLESFKNMKGYMFVGFRDHGRDTTCNSEYKEGDLTLHGDDEGPLMALHGPSIWIRLGGPVCVVDIDIGFCIQQTSHKLERSVLLIKDYLDYDCPVSHWMESVVDPPDDTIHQLTQHHHRLLLLLKYAAHLLEQMKMNQYRPPSSHVLRTLLLHHQQKCQSTQLGECLMETVRQLFGGTDIVDYDNNTFMIPVLHDNTIRDIIYPQRESTVYSRFSFQAPTMLLWLIQHVRHTSDCSWWERLLDSTFTTFTSISWWIWWKGLVDPTFSSNVTKTEILHSLVTAVRSVDSKAVSAAWNTRGKGEPRYIKLEWKHQDETETSLEFAIDF